MPDSALQGVANLIAIGLERARAQKLTAEVEAGRQTERLRTALIDAMAHEFKTPLTSIRAVTSSLLADPDLSKDGRTELVKIADEEAERLKDLIDNAVEMARLDAAHIDIRPESVNLSETVKELIQSMRTKIDGRPMEIKTEAALPDVLADRRLIRLAVKQLIDNALKYSPPHTPVTIQLGSSEEAVQLMVADCGGGIPIEDQPKIFQRFYRSPAVQNQMPGSGLGLSIAYRIVQAHGGDLAVTSKPGETAFQMTLPLHRREVK
jgi:two-component system sensor histidine kinase KdpD